MDKGRDFKVCFAIDQKLLTDLDSSISGAKEIAFFPPGPARARDSKRGFLKPGFFRILPTHPGTSSMTDH